MRQLSRRPTSAGLQSFVTQLSGGMPPLPAAAITAVVPAAMPAMASPCGPLIPESELMPGQFSQPSSPHKSAVGPVARIAAACGSPNKPATPHKAPLRSPFVTRPTRLGFEGPDAAAVPIAQLAGAIEGKPLSEAEAIRLAAAALQMCGTPNAALAFLRQLGNSAVAPITIAY